MKSEIRLVVFDLGGSAETPDFELNDLGRLSSDDDMDAWLSLIYRKNPEASVVRSWSVNGFSGPIACRRCVRRG